MIGSKKDSLCPRILRNKYKVRDDWLRRVFVKQASPIWKAIEKTKDMILKGACYLIGDGSSINVWMDSWIPWIEGFKPKPKDNSILMNPLMVCSLINQDTHEWRMDKLMELFEFESIAAIKKIRFSTTQREDKLIWIEDEKGRFSTKAAYKVIQEQKII